MKYLKTFENLNEKSCNYFESFEENFNFSNHLEKPLYFLLNKRVKATKEWISPDQYFYNISKGFQMSIEQVTSVISNDLVDKYMNDMINGDKFPIGWYTIGSSDQEGRHRYMAAKKLGCKKIPVIKQEYLTRSDILKFYHENKGKTFEQLDKVFKDQGYMGITKLGYNDFLHFEDYYL